MMKQRKYSDDELESILEKMASSVKSPSGKYGVEESYRKLQTTISHSGRFTFRMRMLTGAAAAVLLCLVGWWFVEQQSYNRIQTFRTLAEIGVFTLPDGSEITLNRYSSVEYPQKFSSRSREVTLTGEATFHVKKSGGTPFIVRTTDMEVKVLGTVFNVNAYPDNHEVVTTLLEGSVAVSVADNEPLILKPAETAVYHRKEQLLSCGDREAGNATLWQKGIQVFANERLEDIAIRLSNHFNRKIVVTGTELKNSRITARFIENEELSDILSLIGEVVGYEFQITDGTIILEPGKK